MAREGGRQFIGDPLTQRLRCRRTDLLQEGGEQPATHRPVHAHVAIDLGGAGVKIAVEIDLLVNRRAVTAVFLGRAIQRSLHATQDRAGQRAATGCIKGDSRSGLHQRLGQVFRKGL